MDAVSGGRSCTSPPDKSEAHEHMARDPTCPMVKAKLGPWRCERNVKRRNSVEIRRHQFFVIVLMITVMVTGTANNFASRIRAEVLGDSNFVVAIPDSLIHTLFNGGCLLIYISQRRVTRTQLAAVFRCGSSWETTGLWKYIGIAAVSDVANNITGLLAQPHLTTLMMSLMDQATTPFAVLCSLTMLGTRYTCLETGAVLVVICAAVACVYAGRKSGGENSVFWSVFAAATTSFAAFSFVLKEIAFNAYTKFRAQSLKEQFLPEQPPPCASGVWRNDELPEILSIYIAGTIVGIGSLLTSAPMALLSEYFMSPDPVLPALTAGLECLLGGCPNALPAYLVYLFINIIFNVALLALTAHGSAVLAFLSLKLVVPMTALCSPLPWPIIGSKPVTASQWGILTVMLSGVALFRYGSQRRVKAQAELETQTKVLSRPLLSLLVQRPLKQKLLG